MLNILGMKLHPAVGFVVGAALIVVGALISRPMLCLVGVVMIVAAASRGRGTSSTDDEHNTAPHGRGRSLR